MLRRCAKELKMMPWDVGRCTLTQLLAMLEPAEDDGPADPHAGRREVRTPADLDALWAEWEEEFG